MSIKGLPGSLIELVRNTVVTYKGTVGNPLSLADIAKIARVEPITLISSNLTGTKELYDILHGILNIYSAYYLQAVGILSAELSDIRILKILDKTNPDRDIKTLLASGYTVYEDMSSVSYNVKSLSLENCKFKLPMLESDSKTITLESIFEEEKENNLSSSLQKIETFEKLGVAVGKVIEVKFTVRSKDSPTKDEVAIPVVIKLDTMVIPSEVINAVTTSNKDEITLGSRFKDAINGRINFIKDFLFCSDLIKAQKKTMIKDSTGIYTQLLKRINNSRIYSALSGNISLAGISAVVVMSEEDEQEIQKSIGGKLTNHKTREIVFNNTSAMMIAVVDKSWQRVSIYIRDIDTYSQSPFDSFKPMSSKGDNNIGDILKALNLGTSPSF